MIQASGLASGIDTKSLVQQLVSIERQPLTRLAAKKQGYSRQISKLGNFASKLSEFKTKLEDFKSAETLLSRQSSSENESSVKVKTTGSAKPGTWEIEVDKLAIAQRDRSEAFGTSNDVVRAGTLTIEVWGEDAVEVTIDEGMTLSQVRDRIQESGAKVNASILSVDSGSYLSVTSQKTGHDGGPGMTITESYNTNGNGNGNGNGGGLLGGLGGGSTGQMLNLSTEIAAQNAEMRIDGELVTQSDNTIDGVIEGMSFELLAESSEPFKVTVTENNGEVADKVEELVSAYNALYREANALKEEDHRFGTTAANSLREAMTYGVAGSSLPNLSAVGITTSKDTGELVFNRSKFEEAADSRPQGLVELFGTDGSGIVDRMDAVIERYTDSVDGMIETNKKMWQNRIRNVDDGLERGERRIEAYQARLRRQFNVMEQFINNLSDMSNRFASMMPVQPQS